MLNSLVRHFSRALRPRTSFILSRHFSGNFKYQGSQETLKEGLSALDFLKSEDMEIKNNEILDVETDIGYLEEFLGTEDTKLLEATSSKKLKKLQFLSSDDFSEVVTQQDKILDFEFSDFMKLSDYNMMDKAQRLIDSVDIKVLLKIRIVSHLPELQTLHNITLIIKQAIAQGFEDQDRELEILIGAIGNNSEVLHESIKSVIAGSCQGLEIDKIKYATFSLLTSAAPLEANRLLVRATSQKGSKQKEVVYIMNALSETGRAYSLMDDKLSKFLLKHAVSCSNSLLLETMVYVGGTKITDLELTLDIVDAVCPKIDWVRLLEFSAEELASFSKEQKIILYHIFWKNLDNKKLKHDPHRANLINLLDSLSMYDEVYPNYLTRHMIGR